MSQRDRDARAAMREAMRSDFRHSPNLAPGQTMASYVSAIAEQAWRVADAMQTERAKRERAEAPAPEHHACHAEIAAAMREGRDAGLREVREALRQAAVNPDDADDYEGLMAGVILVDGLLRTSPAPAPDVESLRAELAKLRVVAEAAEVLTKRGGIPGDDVPLWAPMLKALDAWAPGWRTR